jgi:hypothetical protein
VAWNPAPGRRIAEAAMVAAALASLYLLIQPPSADHAAQIFRTGLFEEAGFAPWNNLWFGGHHAFGYGLLFPPLAGLIGPYAVAALAAVSAAVLFGMIAEREWGERARVGSLWFAAGTAISLFTGRLTFALGIAIALGAVLAYQRGHRPVGLLLAALCALASPVAALFLACGAVAYSLAERRWKGAELAAAAGGTTIALRIVFPEGGSEPFVASSFQPAILIAIAVFFAIPREERLLRAGVAVYAVALGAAFLIPTPMGGNATRMGALLLGPLLACTLWRRDHLVLALLAPLLVYWQWSPVVRDLERVSAEPSANADYYQPLRDFLAEVTHSGPTRIEVVPTVNHWDAAIVPRQVSIARGWERQLDRKLNGLFYKDRLSGAEYRHWLDDLAVGYVAMPDSDLDYAGESEAALIRRGLPYLKPVYRSAHWQVYRVRDATPLASGPARLIELSPAGFALQVQRSGSVIVRVRYTPYFALTGGAGCVQEGPMGFTLVRASTPGPLRVEASFKPGRILDRGPACRGAR